MPVVTFARRSRTKLDITVELTKGFGVNNFFALLLGFEGDEVVEKGRDPFGSACRNNPLPLLRPTVLDDIPGVLAQLGAQVASDRFRVALKVPIERREG